MTMKLKAYQAGYKAGFERACLLILGTKIRWTKQDLLLRAKATRKLFGKKRS